MKPASTISKETPKFQKSSKKTLKNVETNRNIRHCWVTIKHENRMRSSKLRSFTIAYDETAALAVSQVYALRARLHRQVYQHRRVKVAEGLLKEQMAHAHITPAARDPERFVALTEGSIDTAPVAATLCSRSCAPPRTSAGSRRR